MIDSFRGKYYFLSNFYNAPVTYLGLTYQNNEAAFQAQKTLDVDNKKKFENLNPSESKKLGRKITLRSDWEEIKTETMYEICLAKFSQNEVLMEKLLETKDEELIEGNTWGDKIWGAVNGVGENRLGKILMYIRDSEMCDLLSNCNQCKIKVCVNCNLEEYFQIK